MMHEILELKKKAKEEYETSLKVLEAEYNKNIDAIDRVFSLLGKDKEPPKPTKIKETTPVPVSEKRMATSQVVRDIIDNLSSDFSVHDIKREAVNMNPPLEVSKNVLHNVIKIKRGNNEIEVVVKGSGRSPSIYKKTDKYKAQ